MPKRQLWLNRSKLTALTFWETALLCSDAATIRLLSRLKKKNSRVFLAWVVFVKWQCSIAKTYGGFAGTYLTCLS